MSKTIGLIRKKTKPKPQGKPQGKPQQEPTGTGKE